MNKSSQLNPPPTVHRMHASVTLRLHKAAPLDSTFARLSVSPPPCMHLPLHPAGDFKVYDGHYSDPVREICVPAGLMGWTCDDSMLFAYCTFPTQHLRCYDLLSSELIGRIDAHPGEPEEYDHAEVYASPNLVCVGTQSGILAFNRTTMTLDTRFSFDPFEHLIGVTDDGVIVLRGKCVVLVHPGCRTKVKFGKYMRHKVAVSRDSRAILTYDRSLIYRVRDFDPSTAVLYNLRSSRSHGLLPLIDGVRDCGDSMVFSTLFTCPTRHYHLDFNTHKLSEVVFPDAHRYEIETYDGRRIVFRSLLGRVAVLIHGK